MEPSILCLRDHCVPAAADVSSLAPGLHNFTAAFPWEPLKMPGYYLSHDFNAS